MSKKIKHWMIVLCLTSAATAVSAMTVTKLGEENEEVRITDPDTGELLMTKDEGVSHKKRSVLRGICRNGSHVLVVQEGTQWNALEPRELKGGNLPPTDIAFLACNEKQPELKRLERNEKVEIKMPPKAPKSVFDQKPGAWMN